MRLFLALELDSVSDALDTAAGVLRVEMPDLAWVAAGKHHVTIKFFGEVAAERAGLIVEAMDRVAELHRPFALTLREVGAFPNFRRARVVWLGVEYDARLELLHHDIEVSCEQSGFELEGRAFRPHVTLARVKAALPEPDARRLARAARTVHLSTTVDVSAFALMESTPTPDGTRYRRLHAVTLGGR